MHNRVSLLLFILFPGRELRIIYTLMQQISSQAENILSGILTDLNFDQK